MTQVPMTTVLLLMLVTIFVTVLITASLFYFFYLNLTSLKGESLQPKEKTYTREEVVKYLIRFCDSIKDYEHESKNLIGFDERDSEEFVKIFLNNVDNKFITELKIRK